MANKYLDDTGLSYLWSQLKTKFLGKNLGSSAANKMLYTDSSGNVSTRKVVEGYTLVNSLPTQNIDENTVYLIPTVLDTPGGNYIEYSISISGNVITLTGTDGSTSTVTLPVYNGGVQ